MTKRTTRPDTPPLALNKVCNVGDFDLLEDVFRDVASHLAAREDFPQAHRHRKWWETCQIARAFAQYGVLREDAEVLGVAAGHEVTMYWLTRHVKRVFATDLYAGAGMWDGTAPPEMLINPGHLAPPGYAWHIDRLVTQHMDATWLRYEDNSFDAVFCNNSLDNMGDLDTVAKACGEIGRVLKPGGIAAITTEYKLSGPDGHGWDGVIVFDMAMLHQYIVKPSGLIWTSVDFARGVDDATLATAFPLERAVMGEHNNPHIVLTHKGYTWTSISLVLQKAAV